ncbi:hypothetical protein [uncultured Methanobrevibacter sp.]|nr:hypothetical protein [uncultured Methanobrevibacter sp.]
MFIVSFVVYLVVFATSAVVSFMFVCVYCGVFYCCGGVYCCVL